MLYIFYRIPRAVFYPLFVAVSPFDRLAGRSVARMKYGLMQQVAGHDSENESAKTVAGIQPDQTDRELYC